MHRRICVKNVGKQQGEKMKEKNKSLWEKLSKGMKKRIGKGKKLSGVYVGNPADGEDEGKVK